MHIDWWTLGLQGINVLVLMWLLARFLFQPVAAIVAERQRVASALMTDAAAAKAAALCEQQRASDETARLARQRGQILETATAEAATLKAALDAAARTEAEHLRATAHSEIDALRQDAAQAQGEQAMQLALDIAAKLFDRLPSEARVAGFLDGLADALAKLPESTREQLGRDGTPIKLTAARALRTDELAACRTALARVLGRDLPIDLAVDTTLIAGMELDAPHAQVRNSLRYDLAHLRTELLAHDHDPA